jgi:hypothetical protein
VVEGDAWTGDWDGSVELGKEIVEIPIIFECIFARDGQACMYSRLMHSSKLHPRRRWSLQAHRSELEGAKYAMLHSNNEFLDSE